MHELNKTMHKNKSILDISKKIFSLALPMTGSQLINVASGFLCMTMLAQLGPKVLAASALIFTTELSIVVSGISILFSLSVLIGHAYGEKKYLVIGNFVQQGWTLALFISIPIIILFLNIKKLLLLFGQTQEMSAIVDLYFQAFVWCVIPELLTVCNQQFGYGIQQKWLMVLTGLLSVLVLLGTAYVLIFGKFGFPNLGVAGLGYARAAQNLFFFLFSTTIFCCSKRFKQYNLFHYRVHHHLNHFAQMIRVGWPICVQMAGEMLSIFVIGIMIGWLGKTALGAFQVVNQYCFLVIIGVFSLSQASGILIGEASGARQFHEVRRLGNVSLVWVLIVTSLVAAIFIAIPKVLASVYLNIDDTNNAETVHYITLIFFIMAFSQMFDGLRHVLFGALRGLKELAVKNRRNPIGARSSRPASYSLEPLILNS